MVVPPKQNFNDSYMYSICQLFVAKPFFHATAVKPLYPCVSSYTPSVPNQPG